MASSEKDEVFLRKQPAKSTCAICRCFFEFGLHPLDGCYDSQLQVCKKRCPFVEGFAQDPLKGANMMSRNEG